jgi:hypothetical protein
MPTAFLPEQVGMQAAFNRAPATEPCYRLFKTKIFYQLVKQKKLRACCVLFDASMHIE